MLIKRISALILCLALALSFSVFAENTGGSENNTAAKAAVQKAESEGYTVVAEDSGLRLYGNMKTGDFALLDKSSGRIWYSGQRDVLDKNSEASQLNFGRVKTEIVSMIALNYVQVSTIASTAVPLYQNSYAYCVGEDNVTVGKTDGGYRASYLFEDLGITVPVLVELADGRLRVTVEGDKIESGDEYIITSIAVLPGFMAEDGSRDGYLFVPSGSGALVPFATGRGEIATYSEMVYGDDLAIEQEEYEGEKQKISVPVYGVKSGDTAVTAIIESGDSTARINSEADSLSSSYTRVYSEYVTAIIDDTTLFESNYENQRIIYGAEQRDSLEDYTVSYTFTHGDKADYSGMAEVYRDYLELESRAEKPSLRVTLYGAAWKKASFLGIPYRKAMALTTFENAADITDELKEAGAEVSLKYIGWNNDGIDNRKAASKFLPVGALGGKSGFKKLYSHLEDSGVSAWFDTDLMLLSKSGNGFSVYSDVCKSIFNTRTPIYDYMLSVYVPYNDRNPHYLLTPDNVSKAADKFLDKYKYDGGISLGDLGSSVYSDFKNGGVRLDCIKFFCKIMEKAGSGNMLALTSPNAYAFKYCNTIFELPMSSDGNLIFSESVPFLQMVLHGSVSYGAVSGCDLLDCIEYGADPAYYGIYAESETLIETDYNWLYSSTYTNWKNEAVELYAEYAKIYTELYDCVITEHSSENGVSKTVFDNGTVIYTNRGKNEVTADGVTVPANRYAVTGGGADEKA